MEDGTFSLANGQLTFDGSEFIVKIGSNKIDDLLNASFNVITNKEHIVVTLDTNSFPVEDINHTITFRVLQGNTTSETPCIINKITPSNEIEGVNFTINNNSCTMSISKETRLFGIVEESFEVELEIKDYKIFKTITWSTISQGRDGQDGANGTPGISSYFHIKYAPNDNPTADEMTETVNTYIGTYVDEIKEDSNDPTKYTWSKLVGEDGKDGKDGIVGKDGEDGVSSYLHIKYSDDMVSFTENNGETPGIYMGQYVDEIKEDSLVFNDYVWAKIKGEDGKNGTNGTPGASSYFHVKYAPNNNPTPEQMTDTPQQYIGTYVDDSIQDSDDPKKYTWIKIQGQDGTSISIDHTVSELPDTGIVGEYYYVTKTGVLWRYEDTGWVELGKIQGEQGIPGKDGENGKTNYLHIRYSNDNGVTFTTNNGEDVGMYMGTYVDFTEEDSSNVNDYKWVRLKGEDGSSASYVKIISNNNLFVMSKGSNEYSPSNIVLTPEYTNCTFGKWQYSTDGGTDWTMVTNGLNGLTISSGILTISNNSPLFTEEIDNISFRVTASDGSSDIVTVARLKDGIDGDDGISATNVFLTNENHTFMATNDGKAIATSISFDVNGYVGIEEKPITFGTITGVPNGMNITKNGSNSTNAKITISVTTDMTSLNGTITIPCICNGITFNKQFSYALSVPGKDGQDGINGTNGINGTSSYFHIKYAPVENPTANQMTETVNTYIGTYVDNNIEDSNNPSDYKWSKFVGQDGNNGNDGLPGKDGEDGTTYYLHVKYSNDGSTFTANSGETPGDYLGQLVDTNKEDSLIFNDYTWKKIKGEDGNDGISGTSSYFHIKYSPVENPTASQMTEVPSDYIGTYVDEIKEDSNDPSKYTWSRFKGQDGNDGEQGLPGEKGKDGTTYYLHIKYSDNGTTFTANNGETPGKYLGQLVDTIEEDSLVFSDYTWKKIEGDVGANASYVKIIANNQVFLKPSNSETYSPSSIKLTPVFTNSTYSKWQYSTNNGSNWTDVTSGSNGLSISSGVLTISNTCSLYTDSIQSISFKVLSKDSTVYDVISILKLKDGVNGTNGSDGKGIKAITNYYLATSSSSGVTTSTSGWTETIQTISTSKKYLWNYEKITYTDNTTYSTSPTIIGVHGTDGTNGSNGKGIKSITEYYLLSTTNSNVTTSTSGWSTTVPTLTATNKYLWNYEKITYTDNSATSTTPAIIGVYGDKGVDGVNGKDGADGKGIKAITNYYLATSSSSGVTVSTSGWTTTVQSISTSKKYLWNYELVTYTDNSTYTTTPTIIGVHGTDGTNGSDGKGIKSITEYYLLSTTNSNVTTSTSGWSTTVPKLTSTNKYLWNYEKITYTDNSTTSSTPAIIGVYGDKGADGVNGKDGKGVNTITNYYLATSSSSGVTVSTSGWTETIQTISTSKKYLWNYEVIAYTDGTNTTTSPTIIGVHGTDGTNGSNGTNGKGISSITEYYLATSSSSGVTTSTSGWTTTVQSMTSTNKYLWNYEVIKYTDNSTTTGSPKIIGVYGDKGATGSAGKDSINVILGNENHTFIASSDGKAVATSVSTSVLGYAGTTAKSCTIGTISGLPTGMTATINNNNSTSASITFTVTTSLTTKNGAVTIPVTCNGVTINKIFSYSLAVAGANGSSSKLIKINAPTNVFKSTDGGVTFKPSSMDFTFTVQNATFSKWQYSIDNGGSWTDVGTTVSGMSVNGTTLSITSSCGLFTESVTAISIKCLSTTSTVYDTLTIYKLYDRIDINEAFEEMELTVTQSNTKWEACFKNSNANNLFLNSDAKTGTTDEWIDNGGGLTISKANAFPFYGSKENYFKTSFKSSSSTGVRYKHDIILEPNTDYIYEGYIYTNASVTGTDLTPLNFRLWTGTTYSNMRDELCTILDYRQTLTPSRFVKCYVHFKTNNVSETIYSRFFIYKEATCSLVGFKRMSLKKGTIETEWTQHPNEVKSSVVSIDETGVNVKHSEIGTTTNMNSQGFSIMDAESGDVLAWLSSKEQWTELKVDKVFASNIENIYTGESNLYVDHSATVAGDGTSDKPFNSFTQLSNHLMANPVINKDIYIVVRDPGFIINEQLYLERLKGTGFIKITLEGNLVIANAGNGQYCIKLHQIPKWVWITSGREFGSKTTGAVLQDGGSGGGHGIYATDVDRLEVDALTIACANWGILTERTYLYTWHVDFGKCYNAIELRYQSMYYSSDDVGSCTDFCRLKSGSFAYWGCGTVRPQGNVQKSNGMYYDGGISLTPTASPRYPSANPTPPSTSGQYFTKTYNCTSKQSYQYAWTNWSSDGSCKQGQWSSSYGKRGGHMFFDMATIRAEMTGTIQDGNTITLTRANSGGISGDANVYINGSSCSSASGTPSYSNQTHLGTLKWGETKTFTLPKAIVQNLINGTCNSLAVYVNSTASSDYINIVEASITLKTKK